MNSIIASIIMVTNLLGNFTTDPIRVMLSVYITLLGDFFYGFIIMGVALIIYTNTDGNVRLVSVAIWLLSSLTATSLAVNATGNEVSILHAGLAVVIGVIASIVVGAIIYKGFFAKSEF